MERHYDEYQLTIRYRIAFRALLLTLALILANGLVNTFHPWAPPLLQAVALLLPPSLYFFTASVRRGAYLSRRERHPLGAALFFLAAAALGALADRIFLGPGVVALLFRGDLGFFLVFLVNHKF